MGIELSDDDLDAIRTHALDRMQDSVQVYELMRDELQKKLPTVTDEAISAVKERIKDGTHKDDKQETTAATFFCAMYQLAIDKTGDCLVLLRVGNGDGDVMRKLMWATSTAFEMLTRLAITLNGGVFAERITEKILQQRRTQDDKLQDIQQAYDELFAQTGKAPSRRAVAERSGYNRETVNLRWGLLNKNQPN